MEVFIKKEKGQKREGQGNKEKKVKVEFPINLIALFSDYIQGAKIILEDPLHYSLFYSLL